MRTNKYNRMDIIKYYDEKGQLEIGAKIKKLGHQCLLLQILDMCSDDGPVSCISSACPFLNQSANRFWCILHVNFRTSLFLVEEPQGKGYMFLYS